jgi:hypothetical protein
VTETSDRHQRLRAIFDEALTREPSTLEAYLDRACAGDPDLRPELMRLLAAHGKVRAFLEHPPNLPPAAGADEEFAGTARFSLVRQVGAGGMGAVYEVHDSVRDEVVALKTLLRASAAGLYRLKREFRSLVDVTHPNLVCLYELFVEDDRCFFTMELVRGLNFVDYARESERGPRFTERLIPAIRQLIDGVSALHQRGKLHQDIKPSNVLVTREGRVVILDFGLITELLAQHVGEIGFVRAGTPAYMSPEQASGAPPSEASDERVAICFLPTHKVFRSDERPPVERTLGFRRCSCSSRLRERYREETKRTKGKNFGVSAHTYRRETGA